MAGKRSRSMKRTASVCTISIQDEAANPQQESSAWQLIMGSDKNSTPDMWSVQKNLNWSSRASQRVCPQPAASLMVNGSGLSQPEYNCSTTDNISLPHKQVLDLVSTSGARGAYGPWHQDSTSLGLLAALKIEERPKTSGCPEACYDHVKEQKRQPAWHPSMADNLQNFSGQAGGMGAVPAGARAGSMGEQGHIAIEVGARECIRDMEAAERIQISSPWEYGRWGQIYGDELECDWWEPPIVYGAAEEAPAYFLDSCSFCLQRIEEGHDIYMYRGDRAYCSDECRQQQMSIDERSQRCSNSALRMDLKRRNGQPVVQRRTVVDTVA